MADLYPTTPTLIPFALRQLGTEIIHTFNAETLHEFLEVKTRYDKWIERRIDTFGFEEGRDFTTVNSVQGPVRTKEYHVSLSMAKELAMVERTSRGKEARLYFLACEKALKQQVAIQVSDPVEKYPELRAIRELLLVTAEARDEAAQARQEASAATQVAQAATAVAHSAEVRAVRAETKSDMAIEEMHRLTLEEFILENGLLRQFPEAQWPSYVKWLKDFCLGMGMDVRKAPVYGKRWDGENTYPIKALTAWRQHELHKPRQIALAQKMVPA